MACDDPGTTVESAVDADRVIFKIPKLETDGRDVVRTQLTRLPGPAADEPMLPLPGSIWLP